MQIRQPSQTEAHFGFFLWQSMQRWDELRRIRWEWGGGEYLVGWVAPERFGSRFTLGFWQVLFNLLEGGEMR